MPDKAATRYRRLHTLLTKIKDALRQYVEKSESEGRPADGGPCDDDIKEAAHLLHTFGLSAAGMRLIRSERKFIKGITDVFFCDYSRGMDAEQRAAMVKRFGPIPTPLDDADRHAELQKARHWAILGHADSFAKIIDELLDALIAACPAPASAGWPPPAEIVGLLNGGEFRRLTDDEFARLDAWLAANPKPVMHLSEIQRAGRDERTQLHGRLKALHKENARFMGEPGKKDALPGKTGRKRRRQTRPRRLTAKQTLTLELYGKHDSDIAAVARAMERSRATVHQHLQAAWRKLPELAPKKKTQRSRTHQLPTDGREQVNVSEDRRRR